MPCQTEVLSSTWAKAKVAAVTNSLVATLMMKKESTVLAISNRQYQGYSDSDTQLKIGDVSPTLDPIINEVEVPAINPIKSLHEGAWATVIQVWEGTVLSVDLTKFLMVVKLRDRGDLIVEHNAEIDLQWVVDQDYDLVVPGAIFYWTLYKETKRGSISNAQEIRFRRLPNWSKSQLLRMTHEAEVLGSKFSVENRIAD